MQRLGDGRYGVYALETLLLQINSEGLSDPAALMRLYSSLVGAYYEIDLTEKAMEAAAEAERLSDDSANAEELACAYLSIARAFLQQDRKTDALRSLIRGEELYSRLGWSSEVAAARINRGIVLTEKGELDEARVALQTAVGALEKRANPLLHAKALNELARVQRLAGKAEDSVELLSQAERLITSDDLNEQALNARERGLALIALGSPEAESSLRRAVQLYRQSNCVTEVASTLKVLGDVLISAGRTEEAVDAYREGLEAVEERHA